jgi:hypothetical protein
MGQTKSGLLRQRCSINLNFFVTGQEKNDLLIHCTCDCLIEVTTWASLTVHVMYTTILLQ